MRLDVLATLEQIHCENPVVFCSLPSVFLHCLNLYFRVLPPTEIRHDKEGTPKEWRDGGSHRNSLHKFLNDKYYNEAGAGAAVSWQQHRTTQSSTD